METPPDGERTGSASDVSRRFKQLQTLFGCEAAIPEAAPA
jgi:hypothetical protein